MRHWIQLIGWLACVVYSTIPAFWFMIHPFAERWRARHLSNQRSPYMVLLPVWMVMWAVLALVTGPWRGILLYRSDWGWIAAALLFASGCTSIRNPERISAQSNSAGCRKFMAGNASSDWLRMESGRECGIRCTWRIFAKCWHGAREPDSRCAGH